MKEIYLKSFRNGLLASLLLLSVYFLILSLVSGWNFAWEQFREFWPFIVVLSFAFGLQIGAYSYLRLKVRELSSKKVLALTGSTSALAMISCCSHYLVNILPILGVTGLVTFVSQYQTDIFWLGIGFNIFGLFYIFRKIYEFNKHHKNG